MQRTWSLTYFSLIWRCDIVIVFFVFYIQDTTMPKDLETACQLTYATLSNPNTRPLIIIIDALNQVGNTCISIQNKSHRLTVNLTRW